MNNACSWYSSSPTSIDHFREIVLAAFVLVASLEIHPHPAKTGGGIIFTSPGCGSVK